MCPSKIISLSQGLKGDCIRITDIQISGVMRRRLLDLGFVPGAMVRVIRKSPLGDPIAYKVSQTTIALRKEESSKIFGEWIGHDK